MEDAKEIVGNVDDLLVLTSVKIKEVTDVYMKDKKGLISNNSWNLASNPFPENFLWLFYVYKYGLVNRYSTESCNVTSCIFCFEDISAESLPNISICDACTTKISYEQKEDIEKEIAWLKKNSIFDQDLADIAYLNREEILKMSFSDVDRETRSKFYEILKRGKIRTLFMPIVDVREYENSSIEQRKVSIKGYEALTRGPKNSYLENPERLFKIAQHLGKATELDHLCIKKAIIAINNNKELFKRRTLFLNIKPLSFLNDKVEPNFMRGNNQLYLSF
ncbi:MAG: EAL domain-containing protein [Nanoarchaeota archaeon]|nr:EAL domain-containing protein [Nanoarchaeota archaeon]